MNEHRDVCVEINIKVLFDIDIYYIYFFGVMACLFGDHPDSVVCGNCATLAKLCRHLGDYILDRLQICDLYHLKFTGLHPSCVLLQVSRPYENRTNTHLKDGTFVRYTYYDNSSAKNVVSESRGSVESFLDVTVLATFQYEIRYRKCGRIDCRSSKATNKNLKYSRRFLVCKTAKIKCLAGYVVCISNTYATNQIKRSDQNLFGTSISNTDKSNLIVQFCLCQRLFPIYFLVEKRKSPRVMICMYCVYNVCRSICIKIRSKQVKKSAACFHCHTANFQITTSKFIDIQKKKKRTE